MKLILIYSGDDWLSRSSLSLRAVTSDKVKVRTLLSRIMNEDGVNPTEIERAVVSVIASGQTPKTLHCKDGETCRYMTEQITEGEIL